MEENKVATDSDLRKRAELLVKCLVPKACESGCEECISLVFRELVAVRDQGEDERLAAYERGLQDGKGAL